MKTNCDKIHLFLSCNEPSTLVIDDSCIEANTKEVLLGTTTDKDLKFDDHFNRKKRFKSLILFLVLHHT